MALRKELRNHHIKKQKEPNLLSYLDLVALGTVCDVVELKNIIDYLLLKGWSLFIKDITKAYQN